MAERSGHPTFIVRRFACEDRRALELLDLAQLAEHGVVIHPSKIPERPQPLAEEEDEQGEWDLDHIEEVYLSGAGSFWLAWDDDLAIGRVAGQDVGGVIELRRMYVRADYRRRGVGTALVCSLIAHSRAYGARAIELWTEPEEANPRFYRTLGFRQTVGLGPDFGNAPALTKLTGAGEIRMRLDL